MSMAVDQVCWTTSDIVKTPVEIARWTMSFSLTAQTSSTGRPILCTYRPAVDNNEKSQKYYTMIASHADDFLGIIGTCAKVKRTSVWEVNVGSFCRYSYRHHKEAKETNNRVLWGALLFGCIVSFIVRYLCLSAYRRIPNISKTGFIQKIAVTF